MLYFQVVTNALDTTEKTLIHNVAQFVHCFAQGKVGSGFDVSSAVWGSHRYKRFNPAILIPIMVSILRRRKVEEEERGARVYLTSFPPFFFCHRMKMLMQRSCQKHLMLRIRGKKKAEQ